MSPFIWLSLTLIKVDMLFQSLPLSGFDRERERGLSWFKVGIDLVMKMCASWPV